MNKKKLIDIDDKICEKCNNAFTGISELKYYSTECGHYLYITNNYNI